jgi:hypothetical protein
MTRPSVMKETTRVTAWQRGLTSGSISYTLRISWAHPRRRAANEGDADRQPRPVLARTARLGGLAAGLRVTPHHVGGGREERHGFSRERLPDLRPLA